MKKIITSLLLITGIMLSASANVSIINGLTHVFKANSGEMIRGEIILLNTSSKNQRVMFEINEALFSCGQNRTFTAQNPHNQSSSAWFEGDVAERVLAPYEKYVYRFQMHIPDEASLQGSFWSVLMVSVDNPIKEEKLNESIGLSTKMRYAVALLTHVNSFDEVALDFQDVKINQNQSRKALDIQIKNDGSFIEGVALTLEVYDANGNKVDEFTTDRNMVFPGVCKEYKVDVSSLPPGEYQCVLLADCRDNFLGTNLSLSLTQ